MEASVKTVEEYVVEVKNVEEKFSKFVNFKHFGGKAGYLREVRNNDLLYTTPISNYHNQEEDKGISDYLERVPKGIANKSSKIWATVFRVYGALKMVKNSNMNVLDLGCDTAFIRKMIHNGTYVSGTNYVGVDIYAARLRHASDIMKTCSNPAVFVNADLHNGIPFIKSHSADLIYMMEVFEHLEEKVAPKMLEELARILKKTGRVYLTMPNRDDQNDWRLAKSEKAIGHSPAHNKEWSMVEFLKLLDKSKLTVIDTYAWFSNRKVIEQQMDNAASALFRRLCQIHGSAIATQLIGALYPNVGGSNVYVLGRK
jgi:SAM-dependent methyltransferase